MTREASENCNLVIMTCMYLTNRWLALITIREHIHMSKRLLDLVMWCNCICGKKKDL